MKHKTPVVNQNQYSGHGYLIFLINYFCSDQCYLFMSKATQNGRGEKSMQTPGGFKMFSIISSTGCFHGNLRPELSVDLYPTSSYSKALINHTMYSVHYFIFHVYFSLHTYIVIIRLNPYKTFHGIWKDIDTVLNRFETKKHSFDYSSLMHFQFRDYEDDRKTLLTISVIQVVNAFSYYAQIWKIFVPVQE